MAKWKEEYSASEMAIYSAGYLEICLYLACYFRMVSRKDCNSYLVHWIRMVSKMAYHLGSMTLLPRHWYLEMNSYSELEIHLELVTLSEAVHC